MDEDGGGFLDKDEVALLGDKMGQGLQRRHLLDAMEAMDPAGTGEITFDMFKNWLIDSKDGRQWYAACDTVWVNFRLALSQLSC